MPNLRIISDNAADRAAVVATPVVASLPASNLLQDNKFAVCRGTGLAMAISATWAAAETIRAVALPFTNFSPTATMRARTTSEAQATNLLTYSQQMEASTVWVQTAVTIGNNAAVAPDGTSTADKIIPTTANSAHYIGQAVPTQPANTAVTFSVFVKAGEYDMIDINLAPGQNRDTVFDLLNGTIPTKDATVTAKIVNCGGGWYRCIVSAVLQAVAGPVFLVPYKRSVGINFAGDGTSGVYVWGAQLETGVAVSSYFPTTNVPAARPLGYIDNWQSYTYDSGYVACCPAPATKLRGWTASAAASAYGYGGGSCATLWLASAKVATGFRVDIVDTNNLQGYIEVSRLIVGDYWEPVDGAEAGASISVVDNSKHTRTEAGSMLTEVGTRFRKQSLSMPCLNETDRQALWNILMGGGIANPVFISVYPDNANKALEKANAMYGKLVTSPVMAQPYFNIATATLEIEEV